MSTSRSSRPNVSRIALVAIIGGLLLSFAGAAANAANFSLFDAVAAVLRSSSGVSTSGTNEPEAVFVSNGTLDFGTAVDGTTATTANTGFGGVRVGTGGGSFVLKNPGEVIGTNAELRGIAPSTGSINSVGVTSAEYGTAGQVFSTTFEVYFSGGTSGTWYFFSGNGASFGSAQSSGFAGAQVFTGLRFVYGAGNTITVNNRNAGAWDATGIVGTPFAQNTAYTVSIVGNNSAATVNYTGGTVAPNKYDLWVNGTLVGNDLSKALLPDATDINAFRFYGENSTGSVATIALDNIVWENAAVLPAGSPTPTNTPTATPTNTPTATPTLTPTPPPTFAIDDVTMSEGNTGNSPYTLFTFTITKTGNNGSGSFLALNTFDGPGPDPATGELDYVPVFGGAAPQEGEQNSNPVNAPGGFTCNNGNVSFTAAETSKTVSVCVTGDTIAEADETFTLHINFISNGSATRADGLGTIINDDAGATPTPTNTPTATPTNTPTATPTNTPTATPTSTPTATATATPSCTPGNYVSTTSTGATIVPGTVNTGNNGDDVTTNITLPFSFGFYGQPFTSANVSSNGNLQFTSNNAQFTNEAIPTVNMNNLIGPLWDDLRTDGGGGGIFTSVSGSAPNRIFNIEWRATFFNSGAGVEAASPEGVSFPANFEIRLYETTGQIDFVYANVTGGGSSATVGLQKGDGSGGPTTYNQFSFNTASLSNGMKITWLQPTCASPSPTPTPLADLAITKTDGVTVVTSPGSTTYTIVVTNNGPAPAVDARVTDIFPAGITVDNWTCLPQNQAQCRLDGAGNINELVYIPMGGILTYTAVATIASGQTGTLVNTATVTAPPTVIDPNLANNTSTDTDTYGMSISGNVTQFVQGGPNTPLAGVLVTAQPGGATATTNAAGNYTIAGTPGTTYTLTPTMAGKVFDPTSRTVTSTGNVTGVDFIAYNSPNGIPRNIFVVNTHATPGNAVTVPIRMTSQGTEKTMAFSLDYPLGTLFTPVVTCGASTPGCVLAVNNTTPGKLGVTITAAGAGVAAGLREIANITFQTNVGFAPPNAPLTFSDTPTAKAVRDAANNTLQATYTDGFVVFVDGVESDVAGRNSGNGDVLATDVTQVRRFVANLDATSPAFNEFQRADAAPSGTFGDGVLNVADVVQSRRYASRLDGLTAAAGPAGPPAPPLGPVANPVEEEAERPATDREFRLTRETADAGRSVSLGVEYSPRGDEAGAGFTIEYNAARLTNARIELGEGMPEGTVLTINDNDKANGRIGVLIDSSTPLGTSSNIKRLITITFDVAERAPGGETRVRFTNSLVAQGVSDVMGNTLDARYTEGAVMISGPQATGTELSGRVTTADGRGIRGAQVTILDATGRARTVTTGTFGYYRFDDVAAGEAYTIGVTSRGHRFAARTVSTTETNLSAVDFIAPE